MLDSKTIENIKKLLCKRWRNIHDVEDAVSHGCIQYLKHFSDSINIPQYIYTVASNHLKDISRKSKIIKRLAYTVHQTKKMPEDNPLNTLEYKEDVKNFYNEILKLNDTKRNIILSYLDGKSEEEIASNMNIKTHCIYAQISRIRNKLKDTLNP